MERKDITQEEQEEHSKSSLGQTKPGIIKKVADETGKIIKSTKDNTGKIINSTKESTGKFIKATEEKAKNPRISLIMMLMICCTYMGVNLGKIPKDFIDTWSKIELLTESAYVFGNFVIAAFLAVSVYHNPDGKIQLPNLNDTKMVKVIREFTRNDREKPS